MKGKTLTQLAAELERIRHTAKDYVAPVAAMSMNAEGLIEVNGLAPLALNSHTRGQLAAYADIPKAYFDRLATENPRVLSENVNHAFSRPELSKDKRLVRTLDGRVRGFLSSRYRILDGYDLLNETLPVMLDHGFQPVSTELTERRLYVKATTDRVQGEVNKGDVVQMGIMLTTSDVGAGALRVEPYFLRLACLNGMVSETKMTTRHLGKNLAEFEDVRELFSDATRELDDRALFAKVRDVLTASLRPENFQRELDRMRVAAGLQIKNFDLESVVELAAKKVGIVGESNKQNILAALATGNEGAGLTAWGLANSFTAAAKADGVDYDTATALERAGGEIINLSAKDWRSIAEVAA